MALLSALVKAVADVEGIDEVQVGWVARHLREARLLSQAGRGRGAAHMTCTDAANLLIGVNAATTAKEAVAAVQSYGCLVCSSANVRGGDQLSLALSLANNFASALASLISAAQPLAGNQSDLAWELVANTEFLSKRYHGRLADKIEELSHYMGAIVSSEIIFHRPIAAVSIAISDKYWGGLDGPPGPPPYDDLEREKRLIARAIFTGPTSRVAHGGDKEELSKISFKTVFEVARALNS